MSKKVSCTATVGQGSERHNHDLDYRASLKHVHGSPDGVIELVPYVDYKTKINELMKPHIDEYNERVDARYKAAWERYNSGVIKTKPRKRDFQKMGYDYYTDHLNDIFYNRAEGKNEEMKMWRSVILGLGDKSDRDTGLISEAEAKAVLQGVVERWPDVFPDFELLGAAMHLDEDGFYHCHIDYKPLFVVEKSDKQEQGLRVSVGQEAALEHMGFEPEQSVINESDKAPIRFNAFRNRLYHVVEEELNANGLRLWYGASEEKEPYKDSSKNQRLDNWKATQEGVNQLQRMKNTMLDIVRGDRVSPESFKSALEAAYNVEDLLTRIGSQKRSRLNKENVMVHFSLFDQLRSFVKDVVNTISHLLNKLDALAEDLAIERENNLDLQEEASNQAATIERYREENHQLKEKLNKHIDAAEENALRKKYMEQFNLNGVSMEQKFQASRKSTHQKDEITLS